MTYHEQAIDKDIVPQAKKCLKGRNLLLENILKLINAIKGITPPRGPFVSTAKPIKKLANINQMIGSFLLIINFDFFRVSYVSL